MPRSWSHGPTFDEMSTRVWWTVTGTGVVIEYVVKFEVMPATTAWVPRKSGAPMFVAQRCSSVVRQAGVTT